MNLYETYRHDFKPRFLNTTAPAFRITWSIVGNTTKKISDAVMIVRPFSGSQEITEVLSIANGKLTIPDEDALELLAPKRLLTGYEKSQKHYFHILITYDDGDKLIQFDGHIQVKPL